MGLKGFVKQALIRRENRKYEKLLQARRMTYGEWCRLREKEALKGPGETGQKAGALGQSKEAFILFASEKGVLAEKAKDLIAVYFAEHPRVQILYGDEDVWENYPKGKRYSPWFKPDWSPDLFDECFYFGNAVAVRRELAKKAGLEGGFQEKDMEKQVRRLVRLAGGYEKGSKAVGHISEVLFHRDSTEGMDSPEGGGSFRDVCPPQDEVPLQNIKSPYISVIIPSKDNPKLLDCCLRGIEKAAQGVDCEILVVDNGSSRENKEAIEVLIQEFSESLRKKGKGEGAFAVRYLYFPMDFNFSKMCNLGAQKASGEFLLFLNDDVELAAADTLLQMWRFAKRLYTGAVGLKLYYPGSVKIQHAGITNLPMGPVHKLQFLEDDCSYYFNSSKCNRNVLAVTAACLMVEKVKFAEAGGFFEQLCVAFNDVDFCFRLWELGYANVCVNRLFAYHHESFTRGDDESEEKLNRLLGEKERLYERHPQLKGRDPYYSVHLSRRGLDTRIRPAFETAGNKIQEERGLQKKAFAGFREDACLLVRVEAAEAGEICGYCVVLGDNNGCYERYLIFRRESETEGEKDALSSAFCYIALKGQYRPDLAENMPDQENVALCGFWVKLLAQDSGTMYRIGGAAVNRVTGTRLINWTNRKIRL